MRKLLLALLLVLVPSLASAATYTVGPSGRDYTTIQACVNVAQPADICEVYNGSYSGVSSVRAGTSEVARITIRAATGQTPTVASFYITHSYITISGFTINTGTGSGMAVRCYSAQNVILENNTITAERNICVQFGTGLGDAPHGYIIRNNTITRCGWYSLVESGTSAWGISAYANNALIEGNDISHTTNDAINWAGSNSVIRNNYIHDIDADETGVQTGAHIDAIHNGGIPIIESLIEGNVVRTMLDVTGNSHFTWLEGGSGYEIRNLILRYNYTNRIEDTAAVGINLFASTMSRYYLYNNTISYAGPTQAEGHCMTFGDAFPYTRMKNYICYNITASNHYPILYYGTPTDPVHNGNLTYTTGYSGEWTGPISTEATYNTLKNQNPLFVNYPSDVTLQAASPARDAGVALTTVAVADTGSGTSLVVNDAGYFQSGWAGTTADRIRIGASTVATVASVNYTTNTITLTASVTRNDNDPVYLYAKSDGDVVLVGTLPDLGAYEYGATATAPAPPTNVRIR